MEVWHDYRMKERKTDHSLYTLLVCIFNENLHVLTGCLHGTGLTAIEFEHMLSQDTRKHNEHVDSKDLGSFSRNKPSLMSVPRHHQRQGTVMLEV